MSLFHKKYQQFIDELRTNLNEPLRQLIQKFWFMKSESSEQSLKDFLGFFKHCANKFNQVIDNIEHMPDKDLVGNTFNQLISQLDEQVAELNKSCSFNLEKLNLNSIDLGELSQQSDQLLGDIVCLTPQASPRTSRNPSPTMHMRDLANI